MVDPIDRTALIKVLRDHGLYSKAVMELINEAPTVEDDATALIKKMQADIIRVGKLNESLSMANRELVKKNADLKMELDALDCRKGN